MGDTSNGDINANNNGCKSKIEGLTPALGMVLIQTVLAGVSILYKLALNDGMDVKILVAYRYLFASAFLCPLALFLERNKRPTLTWKVLLETFGCALFGATLSQNLLMASMKMTSATFASAMMNLVPAITFILTILLRMEKLGIKTAAGKAKVLGTIVGLAGAMVMTFYKGPDINLWSTTINLINHNITVPQPHDSSQLIQGALLAFASCIALSLWMIIQAKVTVAYPCPYSSTALMCLMGSIQATIYALCFNRDVNQWRFGFDIRLLTVSYSGIVASGLIFSLMAWIVGKRGPVFATNFNPLMLIIVAIVGSLLLDEKLHVGSIIGTVLIIIGLYMNLWGKGKEVVGRLGKKDSSSIKSSSESRRESLEFIIVDGITISRNASLSCNSSLPRISPSLNENVHKKEICAKSKEDIESNFTL